MDPLVHHFDTYYHQVSLVDGLVFCYLITRWMIWCLFYSVINFPFSCLLTSTYLRTSQYKYLLSVVAFLIGYDDIQRLFGQLLETLFSKSFTESSRAFLELTRGSYNSSHRQIISWCTKNTPGMRRKWTIVNWISYCLCPVESKKRMNSYRYRVNILLALG